MDKLGYQNQDETTISTTKTENLYDTESEKSENYNIEDLPKLAAKKNATKDTSNNGSFQINSLSEKTKNNIIEGENIGEIKTDKKALKSMSDTVNSVLMEQENDIPKIENIVSKKDKKTIQINRLKNRISLFVTFINETKNEKSDSDEFKELSSIATRLEESLDRIKDDGKYPSDLSRNIDALHIACILYNSKNRGTRHTVTGASRQKNVAKMLSFLNFNAQNLEVLRPVGEKRPSLSKLTKQSDFSIMDLLKKQEESPIDKALKKNVFVPVDLRYLEKNSADNELSIENTKSNIAEIESLLSLPAVELEKYAPEKIGALKIMLYRCKSHLMLNENRSKGKEDSTEMKEVKESLFIVEKLMSQKNDFNPNEDIDKIAGAYAAAISASRHYIKSKNPRSAEGKARKRMVEENLSRLLEESEMISMAASLMAVNAEKSNLVSNPQDLLLLASYHKGREDAIESSDKNDVASAYSLTLEDFQALAGTKNLGSVEFSSGKMSIIENTSWEQTDLHEILTIISGNEKVPSVANRQMKERLYEICCEKCDASLPESEDFLRGIKTVLGLNSGAAKSAPVSRKTIVNIVLALNHNYANYKKIIKKESTKDMTEDEKATLKRQKRIAEKSLLFLKPQSVTTDDWGNFEAKPTKKIKNATISKINSVLKSASRQGVVDAKLDTHQMDNLIGCNLSYFIDLLSDSWNQVYKYAANITNNNKISVDNLLKNQSVSEKLAALVMLKIAATKEDERNLRNIELNTYIKDLAYSLASDEQKEIQKATSKMNIYLLSDKGSEGLDTILEEKLDETPAFKGAKKMAKAKKGTRLLKDLCDNLSEISKLSDDALEGNLSEEKANHLKKLGQKVQTLLENNSQDMEFVAKELKNTRFNEGFNEAKKLLKEGYSFKDSAELLANTYVKQNHEEEKNKENKSRTFTTDEKIALLNQDEKAIVNILRMEDVASSVVTRDRTEAIAFIKNLKDTLRGIPKGKTAYRDLKIGDVSLKLVQKEDNSLHVIVGGHAIPVEKTADRIANSIEEDMLLNTEIFGEDFVKDTLSPLDVSGENQGVLVRSRNLCIKYLAGKMHKPETFFANISSEKIKEIALDVVNNVRAPEDVLRQINLIESKVHINGEETKELLHNIDKLKGVFFDSSNVTMPQKQEEKKEGDWSKEQKQVVDLIADLIFSKDTWFEDYKEDAAPGSRIKNIISSNLEGMAELITHPETLVTILDNLPIDDDNMKMQIITDINEVLSDKNLAPLKKLSKNGVVMTLKSSMLLPTSAIFSSFASLEGVLDNMANSCTKELQKEIKRAADAIFVNKNEKYPPLLDPNEKGITSTEKKKRLEASKERLNALLEDSIKGDEGQGKFLKNLLSNYFDKSSTLDKRSMLASAIRNSKPKAELQIDENMSEEEKEVLIQNAKLNEMGNYLGGFLKGAGPLLQKELQGIPQSAIPQEIQAAVKDMKSNLTPIPDKIVKAQMQNIVDRSNGKITRIKVNNALGAASVGQTFLCTFYGPGMENGKDTVVKLLRPDVRNRMMREKEIMLWCAKKTDGNIDKNGNPVATAEKGGMEATYEGKLLRIEEELDLTIEAKNAQKGTLYDRGFSDVKAMKVDNSVEPTTNSLVLEKASGTTVDKYLSELKEINQSIFSKYTGKNSQGTTVAKNINSSNSMEFIKDREKLKNTIITLRKRQKHLANLTESWVTEGIYGEGFYHGDLHAGNIMIDDDKVTLIDFGNATKLNEEQIKHITRMMMAAAIGDVDIFEEGFHSLLQETPEEKYKAKRDNLRAIIKDVMALGDASCAGQRIAVALVKAQNLGLELPPAIFNFSQSQIRLQDTIDTMNNQIKEMEETLRILYSTGFDNQVQGLDPLLGIAMKNGLNTEALIRDDLKTNIALLEIEEDKEILKNDVKNLTENEFCTKYYSEVEDLDLSSFEVLDNTLNEMIIAKEENKDAEAEASEFTIQAVINMLLPVYEPADEFPDFQARIDGLLAQHSAKGYEDVRKEIRQLSEKVPSLQSYKAYSELLKAYNRFDKNEITKEELDSKEQVFFEKRKEFRINKMLTDMSGAMFKLWNHLELMYVKNEGIGARIEATIKSWYEDNTFDKSITDRIRDTYNELKAYAFSQDPDEVIYEQKKRDLLLAMQPALLYRVKEAYNLMSAPLSKEEPKSFVDIMGGVINGNVYKSMNMLGKWKAIKVRSKMKNM